MTLTIHLSAEVEKKLLERAARNGLTLAVYVQELLEREAQSPGGGPEPQANHLTPELRQWLEEQVKEEETIADLQELRDKGGPELQEFLPALEQVVHERERTNR
jgi:hypothetical protein